MALGWAVAVVLGVGYVISLAPKWAFEAVDGRWGVTMIVLGALVLAFLFLGPLVKHVGVVPLFSWLMFAIYELNWWNLFARLSESTWNSLVGHSADSVDHVVLNVLGFLVYLAFMALLLTPVLVALGVAFLVNEILVALRTSSRAAEVEPPPEVITT